MSQKRPVSIILGPAEPESFREALRGKRRGFRKPLQAFGRVLAGRPLGGACWEAPGRSGGRRRPRTRPKCENRENGPGPPPQGPWGPGSRIPPQPGGPEGQGDPPGSPENSISVPNNEGFGV